MDADSYTPPDISKFNTLGESVSQLYTELHDACSRCNLNVVRQGKFFMVINTAREKLLQGFLIPQTDRFCVFFQSSSMTETVQCADVFQAERYVKSFFSIDDDDDDEAQLKPSKNDDV
jgi:hypothetical protein